MLYAPHMARTLSSDIFTILLGGALSPTARLLEQIDQSRIIAADSGIAHATTLGITPELWIGDFDSATADDQALYQTIPRAEFPTDKAKTDGELAIETALDRGAKKLILVGAFGGARADHALLHMTQAIALAERGITVLLTSGDQEGAPILAGNHELNWPSGTQFSVIGMTALEGLTLIGAKWPLDNHHVPFGSSLTLSNEISGNLTITLKQGRAVALCNFPNGHIPS